MPGYSGHSWLYLGLQIVLAAQLFAEGYLDISPGSVSDV